MKAETRLILEKARAALRGARSLVAAEDADGALSRAYYAVFHAATAVLHEHNLTARTHSGTHDLFYLHFVKEGPLDRELARTLATLQRQREDATYTLTSPSPEAAQEAADRAEAFVAAVTDWLGAR